MALTLGTNCGFVTSAPVDDPAASDLVIDSRSWVIRHLLPADATTITEMGWYCDNATEEANFEVGIYDDDGVVVPGEAGTRLFVDDTNAKGTGAGWKVVTGLSWDVSAYAGTNLWLGLQLDDTATTTNGNYMFSGGSGMDIIISSTSLINPFGGGALGDADAMGAIYAVYTTGAGGLSINVFDSLNRSEGLD